MALKVQIGLMDLWKLNKMAEQYVKASNNPIAKKDFDVIQTRLPIELKVIDLQDPNLTLDVEVSE